MDSKLEAAIVAHDEGCASSRCFSSTPSPLRPHCFPLLPGLCCVPSMGLVSVEIWQPFSILLILQCRLCRHTIFPLHSEKAGNFLILPSIHPDRLPCSSCTGFHPSLESLHALWKRLRGEMDWEVQLRSEEECMHGCLCQIQAVCD